MGLFGLFIIAIILGYFILGLGKLHNMPIRSTAKILSREKGMLLDVHEAMHFCETKQLPFRVLGVSRLQFSRKTLQRGDALIVDLSASVTRQGSVKFSSAFEQRGFHTKNLIYDKCQNAVDKHGFIAVGCLSKVLENCDDPNPDLEICGDDWGLPVHHFDKIGLVSFMPYLSATYYKQVEFALDGVPEAERTCSKLLSKLEALELLTIPGHLDGLSLHSNAKPLDLQEFLLDLDLKNAPGFHIAIGSCPDMAEDGDNFNFDLYGDQPRKPDHHFLVVWNTWTDEEGINFRRKHRISHMPPSPGVGGPRERTAFTEPANTPTRDRDGGRSFALSLDGGDDGGDMYEDGDTMPWDADGPEGEAEAEEEDDEEDEEMEMEQP